MAPSAALLEVLHLSAYQLPTVSRLYAGTGVKEQTGQAPTALGGAQQNPLSPGPLDPLWPPGKCPALVFKQLLATSGTEAALPGPGAVLQVYLAP